MKNFLSTFSMCLVMGLACSATVYGESTANGTIVNEFKEIEGFTNKSDGSEAKATMGAVRLYGSDLTRYGEIRNSGVIKDTINSALTRGATANVGAVTSVSSDVKGGKIINEVNISNSSNYAFGNKTAASIGSVRLKDSTVFAGGIVKNTATIDGVVNDAVNRGAGAGVGSIEITDSSKVNGVILNNVVMTNGSNLAQGIGAKAIAGGIYLE